MTPEQEKELRKMFEISANWEDILLKKNVAISLDKLISLIPQIQQILSENTEKVCEWKEIDFHNSYWATECKFAFFYQKEDDALADAKKFCPYCSGKIKEVRLPQNPKEG